MRYFARIHRLLLPIFCLLLAACASEPVLIAKDASIPAGVDLSGRWALQDSSNTAAVRMPGDDEQLIPSSRAGKSRRQRGSSDGSVRVFLEYGRSLKISQTAHGIFISYDRSVVEEFTFGENRIVSVGPIAARRVSGWEDGAFVVETVDDSGTYLLEAWSINAADLLTRRIRMRKGETVLFEQQQSFERR